ncbi:transcription factor steA [Cryptococcus wingfieldii CBS 7118]|uniref:Transcription factor steA n=1 Tax=Cryptococcus wingfieldii CBS 7118 TaxID=1295528 RepID=A0A1E3J6F0_9TREE|nr:transcription factor steA [Cryptococcus wingfieldii CBS 7118]ODN96434.1 transcription factor steA [Cryptococcus wingfieldii CBS 7118]
MTVVLTIHSKRYVFLTGHLQEPAYPTHNTHIIIKVFYWFSVPHDRLFLDALERDLKREKAGQEPTSVVVGEPASSFRYDPHRSLYEQFSRYILERNPKSRLVPTLQSATDALDTHADPRALDLCHVDVQHDAQVYFAPLGQQSIITSPSRDTMNTSRRHGIGHVIPMEPNVSVDPNSRLLGQRTSPVQTYETEPAPSHEALTVGSRIFDPYHHEKPPPSDQIFPLQASGPSSSFGHVYDTAFKLAQHVAHYHAVRHPSGPKRLVEPPSAVFQNNFPGRDSSTWVESSADDDTPPPSPEEEEPSTLAGPATVSAQMKCKVFIKQSHQQWKSLGPGKLRLYSQAKGNVKQLVVESDSASKQMLVSTIVLTDGVERVAKTGVAVEISNRGKRTGVVYMIQLRNEASAVGLFESLLVGSDRAVVR